MSNPVRYLPEKPLPSYVFVPGQNPHPKKTGGHMEGESDPIAPPLDLNHPEESQFLRYALDLYNFGFYWESHVYFEALWNAHQRVGVTADFLKALIKVGAAGVKVKVGQTKYAVEHFERAVELIQTVQNAVGDIYLGFDLKELKTGILKAAESPDYHFNLHPQWK